MTAPAGRVLVVNTADVGGGAERMAAALHRGYRRSGWDSWLVVGDRRGDDDRTLEIFASPHLDHRPYARRSPALWRSVRKAAAVSTGVEDHVFPYSHRLLDLTAGRPDVVHLHNLHGPYFDLRAVAPLSHAIPVVVTLHDSWLWTGHCGMPAACDRWLTGCGHCPDLRTPPAVRRDATRVNLRRKRRWLAPARLHVGASSRYLLDRLARSSLAPAVVEQRLVPYGIDLDTFRPGDRQAARFAVGVADDVTLLVFTAVDAPTNPYKDYATVRAAAQLVARDRPTHLVVLGADGGRETGGGLVVDHRGHVGADAVAEHLRAADAYVHGAREESFGIALLEAMACGVPVVASDVGAVAEATAGHARLVPPGDAAAMAAAVLDALDSPGDAALDLARRRVEDRHDERAMVAAHVQWLEDLTKSKSETRAAGSSFWRQ